MLDGYFSRSRNPLEAGQKFKNGIVAYQHIRVKVAIPLKRGKSSKKNKQLNNWIFVSSQSP